jgi:parallel beta-helix repeat protein
MSNIYIKNLTAIGDGSSDDIFNISMSVFSLENLSLSSAGGNGIYFHNSDGEIDNLTSSNNKESGIVANRSRIRVENSVFSGNEEDGINLYQASSLELRSSTISSNTDQGIEAEQNSTIKVRDSTISNNSNEAIIFGDGSFLVIKNSTISGVSGKQAIHGYNNAVLKILEDSGSTVISTTNNVAIRLSHNSTGQIGSGVEVTSTGTNGYGVQVSRGGLIRIDSGATITGDSSRDSIDGIGGAKIDIDYGATVQSVVCASDNQTMVFLNGSSGNYPSPTIGSNCITVKY